MESEESAARSHFENLLSSPEGSDMLNKTMTSLRTMIESHKKTLNNVHSSDEKVSLRLKFLYTLYVTCLSIYVINIHHTHTHTSRYDTDSSRSLDRAEFAHITKDLGLSKDESEKLFKEIDVDSSNTITPDELRHYLLSGESNKTFEIQEKILEESDLDVSTIAKQMLFSRFFRHYMNDPKSIKPSELENESQFLFAIQKGSMDYIKSALKTNPYLKNAMSADQRASAMHVAIECKQY